MFAEHVSYTKSSKRLMSMHIKNENKVYCSLKELIIIQEVESLKLII